MDFCWWFYTLNPFRSGRVSTMHFYGIKFFNYIIYYYLKISLPIFRIFFFDNFGFYLINFLNQFLHYFCLYKKFNIKNLNPFPSGRVSAMHFYGIYFFYF